MWNAFFSVHVSHLVGRLIYDVEKGKENQRKNAIPHPFPRTCIWLNLGEAPAHESCGLLMEEHRWATVGSIDKRNVDERRWTTGSIQISVVRGGNQYLYFVI